MNEFDHIYTNTRFDREPAQHMEQVGLASPKRRFVLSASVSIAGLASLGLPNLALGTTKKSILNAFANVPLANLDTVTVPQGYVWATLNAWGDPIQGQGNGPAFKQDASNTAPEQMLQSGMHHDGMSVFNFPKLQPRSSSGLLVVNHEYTDDGLLHVGGMDNWSAEKVSKSIAAHGVSVMQIERTGKQWQVVQSTVARRITAATPMEVTGPARGHSLLKTAADADGTRVLGTLNNCANGQTLWGTYLTCEENFNGYFVVTDAATPDQNRYGINQKGFGYRWQEHEARFNATLHPNEPNRFGWVVEIDPYDAQSTPKKRTALGRFKHEGAMVTQASDGRIVVYMGDDERNEYIYKFVTKNTHDAKFPERSRDILDEGTLFVAKFNGDGKGVWLPMVFGQGGLTPENGFTSQAEVCIRARQAADRLGATMMDRPEWIAVHPKTNEVYVTCTNNTSRGGTPTSINSVAGTTLAGSAKPPTDAANPRADNAMGHIVRWKELANNASATQFNWDIFVLAGDRNAAQSNLHNSNKGDVFGAPDGLWFDPTGVLWVQTDISTSTLGKGNYANMPTNMMLVADTESGQLKRFLTGPRGCEVTGIAMSSDRTALFVNIQHPGESPSERADPNNPKAISAFPDQEKAGRPRSATIVISREDGGKILGI